MKHCFLADKFPNSNSKNILNRVKTFSKSKK